MLRNGVNYKGLYVNLRHIQLEIPAWDTCGYIREDFTLGALKAHRYIGNIVISKVVISGFCYIGVPLYMQNSTNKKKNQQQQQLKN